MSGATRGKRQVTTWIGRQPGAGTGANSGTGTFTHVGAGPLTDDGTWSADPYAHALRTGRGPLFLRRADGWLLLLEVERWCSEADAVDLEVVRRCEGAVLDVGCGPGRLVAALGARGWPVLGIDVSEEAVARTIGLGGQALRRSVFEALPAEGRWGTALLLDGNLGIGGDPSALLARMAQLLCPGGMLIAETVSGPDVDERVRVHVTDARGAAGSPSPGPDSARRPCCGTRVARAGVPSISGQPATVASSPCATAARTAPPNHRRALPSPTANAQGNRRPTGRSRTRSAPSPAR